MRKYRSVTPSVRRFYENERKKIAGMKEEAADSIGGLNKKDQYQRIIGQWPYIKDSQLRRAASTSSKDSVESRNKNIQNLKNQTIDMLD